MPLKKLPSPPVVKSSRHSKITGDFGEALVLYALSRHGYECARVDHTGIDIIARQPSGPTVLGISVKTRSRSDAATGTQLNVRKSDIAKAEQACAAFNCTPYFAIVIDEDRHLRVMLLSLERFLELCPGGAKVSAWRMGPKHVAAYRADAQIQFLEFERRTVRWAGAS